MSDKGKAGEEFAAGVLAQKGYEILERNYYSRYGEIDIIATDGENLCFVEVKTRKMNSMVSPAEAVTISKRKKIIATALLYVSENEHGSDLQPRFDIFCVFMEKSCAAGYDYLMGVFDCEEYG